MSESLPADQLAYYQRYQQLGLTHEDFAILCRADDRSPVLLKMMVAEDADGLRMLLREREKRGSAPYPDEAWETHRRQWFPAKWGAR